MKGTDMNKLKTPLTVVLAIVLAVALALGIAFLIVRALVIYDNESLDGFDEWDPEYSRLTGDLDVFLKKDFLTEFPYADGDYHYDSYESLLLNGFRDRSFVWLTYSDPDVYAAAKASRFDPSRFYSWLKLYPFEDPDVYGFTFYYVAENERFPMVTAMFGFNDETQTLVFVGFWGDGKKEIPYIEAGITDFAGYLDHYFGEWFDWTAGVGIHE